MSLAQWIGRYGLDLKIAWRMLRKSPGLTIVGILSIALGTALSTGSFVVMSNIVDPRIPLDEGDRIVSLSTWDARTSEKMRRSSSDFIQWREQMRSVEQIGAASLGKSFLTTEDTPPQPVNAAEMTAAGFQVARVQPLFGRYLRAEDEADDAPPVAVLGYDLWQTRFNGDRGAVGRLILIGNSAHEVVGVMPSGFKFPRNVDVWTALRVSATRYERGSGPDIVVFGRLVPGATREQVQAELDVLGRQMDDAPNLTGMELRPRVQSFSQGVDNVDAAYADLAQAQLMVTLILLAIAANVAVLVYARTARRLDEIAIRIALGANRLRVVAQLFLEALLLSTVGAGLGLAMVQLALPRFEEFLKHRDMVGFWVDYSIRPQSAVYTLALVVVAAFVVGALPGLKATGRNLKAYLGRLGAGTTIQLGGTWTAMIVLQVTIAITILPMVLQFGSGEITRLGIRANYPADEFVSAQVAPGITLRPGMDAAEYRRESAIRFADRLPLLQHRLEADPAVTGVTVEGTIPGRDGLVLVEGLPGPADSGSHRIRASGVAPNYFQVLGLRLISGQSFHTWEAGESGTSVVVNQAFARTILGDGNPLGRHIRFLNQSGPEQGIEPANSGAWLVIVGVVQNSTGSIVDSEYAAPEMFYAVAAQDLQAPTFLIRVRNGDVAGFIPHLREVVTAVDPELRFGSVGNHADTLRSPIFAILLSAMLIIMAVTLLLSAAGIHALMSLTITLRRREIGVRRALGSPSGRLIVSIFAPAGRQLGLGVLIGTLIGGILLSGSPHAKPSPAVLLGATVLLMLAAGLTATVGPALRGLRVRLTEALRQE